MKIVFRHDGVLPVQRYGGTERILFWHMRELVRQGHRVVLVGNTASRLSGTGIELVPFGPNRDASWLRAVPSDADVIHLQYEATLDTRVPVIHTLHGNGQPGETFSPNTVFLSAVHARNHGGAFVIPNALDLAEYPFPETCRPSRWDSFLFLAKASWRVKNLRDCVRAVRAAKKTLHVGGGRYRWPSRRVRSHGMVTNEQKLALMRGVDALLFPVRWHEPFGLAAIEAMSQGLPVIASSFGSLPEIVTPETGVLCRDFGDLERSVQAAPGAFDARAIRRHVETRYGIERYTKAYVAAYERVIAGEKLHPTAPCYRGAPPEKLLPF